MFAWLVDNSWALWLALFLILAAVEMLTLDLFFIMLAVGALVALIASLLGGPFWLDVIVFCVVSLLMILLVRPVAMKHLRKGPRDQRTNVDRLLGSSAAVLEEVTARTGLVKIGGDVWTARCAPGERFDTGMSVQVLRVEGATAVVGSPAPLPTKAVTPEQDRLHRPAPGAEL